MSKQAMGELIKAASLFVTTIIYLFLLTTLIAPGRAFAAPEIASDLLVQFDQQLTGAGPGVETRLPALPVFASNSQIGIRVAPAHD